MQTIERTRWLPYSPAQVYLVLTDVKKFAQIVKRIIALDVLERNGDAGRILATIDLPGGKTIQAEGRVSGSVDQNLAFETEKPFPLAINWQLTPAEQEGLPGTTVSYTVAVDLSAKVAFLSQIVLNGYLSTELESDLDRLAQFLQDEDANG